MAPAALAGVGAMGELALDGSLRPVAPWSAPRTAKGR